MTYGETSGPSVYCECGESIPVENYSPYFKMCEECEEDEQGAKEEDEQEAKEEDKAGKGGVLMLIIFIACPVILFASNIFEKGDPARIIVVAGSPFLSGMADYEED